LSGLDLIYSGSNIFTYLLIGICYEEK